MYATTTFVMNLPAGGAIRVQKGTHWPAGDPVVAQNPAAFSPDPRWGLFYSEEPDGYDAPLEQATAAPGERRANIRRTRD